MPALNPTLTTIARRNHGVLTRADATGAGVSGQQLRRAVERGELDRLHPGVFRIAGAPWTLHQGLLLAVLAGGPGTLASHRSAAYLWGLDGSRPGQPEIVTPRHLRSRSATARCHESTDLHLAQATERDRVPCTGIARTLVDLGAVVPVERVQQSVDDAVRRRLCSWEDLLHALAMHSRRGRRGVGALRAVLDATCGEPVPDSRFNRLVERLILDSSLRPPTVEFEVRDGAGRFIARVDLAYPALKVALELDGRRFHLSSEAFERDRQRQNSLELQGWLVLRYTWLQYRTEPWRIVADIGAAISGRGADFTPNLRPTRASCAPV